MPPDLPNEQELILKKRARRRLVGAIALVLLMIIILPGILQDKAALAPQESIKITMSEQQVENFNSSVVPVAPEVDSNLVAETVPADAESIVAEAKVEKGLVAKATESKPTQVDTQPKAISNFTVQVGVYSDIVNVKQLQEKLKQVGYTSHTEKISTPNGEKIRLRAGKFTSREAAASALTKIQAAGLSGMVMSIE